MSTHLHTIDGQDLCRVHVPPSSFPVEATVKVDKGGQQMKKTAFYVRIGNGTREITFTIASSGEEEPPITKTSGVTTWMRAWINGQVGD